LLAEIENNYSEKEIVSEIIRTRLAKLKDIDPQSAKRRTFAYLLRRGFSPGIVSECLNQA
jgi:SOS response regulatory protein OraA/RecX